MACAATVVLPIESVVLISISCLKISCAAGRAPRYPLHGSKRLLRHRRTGRRAKLAVASTRAWRRTGTIAHCGLRSGCGSERSPHAANAEIAIHRSGGWAASQCQGREQWRKRRPNGEPRAARKRRYKRCCAGRARIRIAKGCATRRSASSMPIGTGSRDMRAIRASTCAAPSRKSTATMKWSCCATSRSNRFASITWRRSSAERTSDTCPPTESSASASSRASSTALRAAFRFRKSSPHKLPPASTTCCKPRGVGVVIDAVHQCMTTRGVHKRGVSMVTSKMLGTFRADASTRAEFLRFIDIEGSDALSGLSPVRPSVALASGPAAARWLERRRNQSTEKLY